MTDVIIDPNPEEQGFEPWNVRKAELNTQPGVWEGAPSIEPELDADDQLVDPNVAITKLNQTPMVMPEGDVAQTPMPEYWRKPLYEREVKGGETGDERPPDDNEKKNSMNQSPGVWEGAPSADILVTEAPPPEPPPEGEGGLKHPVAALGAILAAGQGPLEPLPSQMPERFEDREQPDYETPPEEPAPRDNAGGHSHRHRRR